MTQGQLAAKLGVATTTVSEWERGNTSQMRSPEQLASILEIPYEHIEGLMAEAAIKAGAVRLNKRIKERLAPLRIVTTVPANTNTVADNSQSIRVERSPAQGNRDIPVFGKAHGGDGGLFEFNGEVMGWVNRPPQLDGVGNAYALYVDGDSMYPRFKPGETVWVNPNKPPSRGDDVIVQMFPDDEDGTPYGFIKEFVRHAGNHLILYQHNPAQELKFEKQRVKSVHVVVLHGR